MRFRQVTLQGFRNLSLVATTFTGRRTFLCGANGQGKSNFLEALGYVTALRSFRGTESRALLGLGAPQTGLAFVIEHEQFGESRVTVEFSSQGREVRWEQGRVTRLADFIGKFPTVAFSSQDNQLLRGAPALRRRWLDLTLAAMDSAYLVTLQSYTRAVAERNALLRRGGRDLASIEAFEHELAIHAEILVRKRAAGLVELSEIFQSAHARLVPERMGDERASLTYQPDAEATTAAEFGAALAAHRPRDLVLRSTELGPHRDDLEIRLNDHPAKNFASEGQQRCVVLALRLAQAAYFRRKANIAPVLLCDDVLGELDPRRRLLFWAALEGEPQVIATGTSLPDDNVAGWQILAVNAGQVSEAAGAGEESRTASGEPRT